MMKKELINTTIWWVKRKGSTNIQMQSFNTFKADYDTSSLYNLILEECQKHNIDKAKITKISQMPAFEENGQVSIILTPTYFNFPMLEKTGGF